MDMDTWQICLLLGGGVLGGITASLIGGAAVFTFPVLIAAGLSATNAAATNLLALMPGILLAAVWDRGQLPKERSFCWLLAASLGGALIGALLFIFTPERYFRFLVPILLGFSTVLFAYAPTISTWLERRAAARGQGDGALWLQTTGALVPASIYGGYFGAGAGVLLLSVLSVATKGDYRSANATKNLVTSLNSLVAAAVFAWEGKIVWEAALIMMLGGVAGGNIGARLAQIAPRDVMRWAVVAMGALLTAFFAWRYWL